MLLFRRLKVSRRKSLLCIEIWRLISNRAAKPQNLCTDLMLRCTRLEWRGWSNCILLPPASEKGASRNRPSSSSGRSGTTCARGRAASRDVAHGADGQRRCRRGRASYLSREAAKVGDDPAEDPRVRPGTGVAPVGAHAMRDCR